jgi:hypothetical protein
VSALLDELYFEWLYSQACSIKRKNPARTYWKLFKILFTKEFIWFVPNDDNRAEDGKDLRWQFLHCKEMEPGDVDQHWLFMDCSMLEMFIGLSRRLAFLTNAEPDEWFWELLENLDLRKYNDSVHIPRSEVEDALDRVIWRTYRRNGHGGLFPLIRAREDQREVELWYQMQAYLLERD